VLVILVNDDPFGNNFRVTDSNSNGTVIFNSYIAAHGEVSITCRTNDSGYGNIVTYQDNNAGVGRSFLRDGDRVSL
jgi:hypothetical protein